MILVERERRKERKKVISISKERKIKGILI